MVHSLWGFVAPCCDAFGSVFSLLCLVKTVLYCNRSFMMWKWQFPCVSYLMFCNVCSYYVYSSSLCR